MLINESIKNLYGGISRQPKELRYSNQVEEMDNFIPSVSTGLKRRNPLIKKANVTLSGDVKYHTYDRGDGKESYHVLVSDSGINIFDENFNTSTVDTSTLNNPISDGSYSGINAIEDLELLTVGDTTWFLNKKQVTAMKSDLTPKNNPRNKAFNWIKRSFDNGQGQGYYYYMKINTKTFEVTDTTTEDVATSFSNQINTYYSGSDVFPDFIRAVAIGSIVNVYIAEYYAPDFRVGTGYIDNTLTTAISITYKYVRVLNENGNVQGASIEDYETSFNIITGKWKLFSENSEYTLSFLDIYEMYVSDGAWLGVNYYSNATQALNNVSPVEIYMPLYQSGENEDFDINVWDSYGDQATFMWKDSVAKLSDLPAKMSGFSKEAVGTISVTGNDSDNFTNYYLIWDGDNWAESIKDGIEYKIDETTMPAKLVRQSDGTFVFGYILENLNLDGFEDSFVDRKIGDDDSNPVPSFINSTINNMFFFKNRLCFSSGENVILSEAGSYYNFFSTTAMDIIDSDVIDASVDSNSVSIINNVNITSGGVTLWSLKSQFFLSGGEILSPASTRITPTSYYESDIILKPISMDNEVVFFNKKNSYTEGYVYSPASLQADKSTASGISVHTQGYIPLNSNLLTSSPKYNMLFIAESNSNIVYCYRYHVHNNERIMSSWFRLIFQDYISIVDISVLNDSLNILTDNSGSLEIHSMFIEPKDINNTDFYDNDGTTDYTYLSYLKLSEYNVETKQGSKTIREPFYCKNIKVSSQGKVDLAIINNERSKEYSVKEKHLDRKIFIGGNSDKVVVGFKSEYNTGCQIDSLSYEGLVKIRSSNISHI